ncbi:MAG: 2-methylisocitrate lyase [Nitrospirae bacterium]|nr:MAG: putative phosphoenolpyruvate phosphomutase [Nitrospira sp. OLB3]MBV6470346.1 2-methylisocitrate lyase [Nitrospirota bacterium]MCE7964376.1 phosphoenolpyruvate mutase [Nitrospira sp. NTP2]MCK6493372.1 phosphoenolpyruvate mutase [Nitrospira sp.]MEB2337382.1 phosphoenolpyruvate mutase [Nitrospirales bacterium]
MSSTAGLSTSRQFRSLLFSEQLEFICEAHNGLSARIVQEAGFRGIWASGLSISAQFGVRDNNEASWTQVLENLEFMSDATRIPILLDGDTGYGNFNNMQRLVRKLEQRNIAAVCIEDKLFPKTNSFIKGGAQPLADMQEFCGKIKAGKDAQHDPDFCIIARVEAFICGWGLAEALRRAEAYHQAGADGILIHSALSVPDEILAFKQEWGNRCPVVIVPTKYYATPTDVFRQHGFSMVIWANHLLRSAVAAMQKTARTLKEQQHLLSIEDKVAPVSEIFRLQNAAELQEAEERYLPRGAEGTTAVVLAASRGEELGELTEQQPKTMVKIQGVPILARIVDAYNAVGIKDIAVVRGYKKEAVTLPNLTYVDNDEFAETGELASLLKALRARKGPAQSTIVSYGDVLFNKYIPQTLCQETDDCIIFVDSNWQEQSSYARLGGFTECSLPNSRRAFNAKIYLKQLGNSTPKEAIHGVWMGFLKVSPAAATYLTGVIAELLAQPENRKAGIPRLLQELLKRNYPIRVLYTAGHWLDINSLEDVVQAGNF